MSETVTKLLSEQTSALNAVEKEIAECERKIEALQTRDLRPDLRQKLAEEMREAAIRPIAEIAQAMKQRAEAAAKLAAQFDESFVRRNAKHDANPFSHSATAMALQARFAKTGDVGLILHLRDAVAAGDLATTELIKTEFLGRPQMSKELRAKFNEVYAQSTLPPEVAQNATACQRVVGLHEVALVRFQEHLHQKRAPLERLMAGHALAGTR